MASDWPVLSLNSLSLEVTVGFVGSMAHEYVADGIPFLRSKNIGVYNVIFDDMKYITQEFHEKIRKSSLKPGDVAIVRTGKPGTTCVIPDSLPIANCSDLVLVRVDESKLCPHYLSYYMNSAASQHIESHIVGAVQQHFNVGAAKKIMIPLPSRIEQDRIVHTLKTIDDKIKLNSQINQTLEQMAQALFKSWFVDFDPVIDNALAAGNPIPQELEQRAQARAEVAKTQQENAENAENHSTVLPQHLRELFPSEFELTEEQGWIPKGWRISSIYEVMDIVYGAPFSSKGFNAQCNGMPIIRIRDLKTGTPQNWSEEDHTKKTLIQPGDIIAGMDAEFRATLWPGRDGFLNQRLFLARPKYNNVNKLFIQHSLKPLLAFQEHTQVGTTVAHLGKKEIDKFKVLNPSAYILTCVDNVLGPIHARIVSNNESIRSLTRLRDTLLPKLISGDLRLPEAETDAQSLINEASD